MGQQVIPLEEQKRNAVEAMESAGFEGVILSRDRDPGTVFGHSEDGSVLTADMLPDGWAIVHTDMEHGAQWVGVGPV